VADRSAIEWTDATWNPVTGCTKVSPGCKFCYAERITERFGKQKFSEIILHPNRLDQPLRWRTPRRIFVNSMSDLFHEEIPDDFIDRVFAVMFLAQDHIYQVLTKRHRRMSEYLSHQSRAGLIQVAAAQLDRGFSREEIAEWFFAHPMEWPLPNVWLGVSCEDQPRADERIPWLLQSPAAVRFVSLEPLLGPVTLKGFIETRLWEFPPEKKGQMTHGLDWGIIGCESGPKRQPMRDVWARSLIEQFQAARRPVFMKQMEIGGRVTGDPNRFPEDLRVRQFPVVGHDHEV
jgi:protein gp37